MIDLTSIEVIYLYNFKVDMRKGILGLSILAQDIVPLDEMKKNLFIFDIEAEINKKDEITAQKVIDIRREKEKPIFEEIRELCEKHKTSKIELLSDACEYFIKHYDTLTTFLANALLPCHNNKAERVVGEFVRSRRNFQTMVNEKQAQNNSILFTIVQTARINNLNVEKYRDYVIDKIYLNADPTLLLPWNKEIKKQFSLEKQNKSQEKVIKPNV